MSHTPHKHEKAGADRRRHARLPVVEGMIEPITVKFDKENSKNEPNQPAILTNLSAGGMSLLMFLEPPHTKKFDMVLSIPPILLAIITVAVLGPGLQNLILVLGFTRWPRYTRVAYGQTLRVATLPFITASRGIVGLLVPT